MKQPLAVVCDITEFVCFLSFEYVSPLLNSFLILFVCFPSVVTLLSNGVFMMFFPLLSSLFCPPTFQRPVWKLREKLPPATLVAERSTGACRIFKKGPTATTKLILTVGWLHVGLLISPQKETRPCKNYTSRVIFCVFVTTFLSLKLVITK